MRDRSLRGLSWGVFIALFLVAAPATSQPEQPSAGVRIIPPSSLTVGDRASIIAEVTIIPAGNRPILLTPSAEGTAVEVVRGRLLRADAVDPDAEVLRFSIPIVAATAGTAVLRVHVSGWACEERCRSVEDDAEVVLRVARAPISG